MGPDDTIFAIASGAGRAGVAIVRVSGGSAQQAVRALTGAPLPIPRRATLRTFGDPTTRELIDRGLLVWFPRPHSFTGEDVAELHVHGGRAVLARITDALAAVPGLRAAEAGEFSRRAFANGKLDLTQAEGLADLVAAETEAQRRQAMRQLEGELGRLYERWRVELLAVLALAETAIDFADEELPPGLEEAVGRRVAAVAAEIAAHLDDRRVGERTREGLYVPILGAPNVGKSSLLNRLARREVAIVAATAGTTRDVIEVQTTIAGFPVTLADTAGLRAVDEEIEREGVRRARDRASRSDLRLAVFDAETWPERDPETAALVDEQTLVVINKADLVPGVVVGGLAVSARTGQGLDELWRALERQVVGLMDALAGGELHLSRSRHRHALVECAEALARAQLAGPVELRAEDLRLATRALGRITGRVDVEDVLDVIFREFCIGK